MLTSLDDSLWHQIASPIANVGPSDHRFFDRMWFAIYDPAGSTALQFTVGVYNNMNVIDGGFVVIRGSKQYNLRVTRSLRPRFEPVVDAMRIEVIKPMAHVRLIVDAGEHPVHGVLDWRAVLPPELEKPHVVRGRRAPERGLPAVRPGRRGERPSDDRGRAGRAQRLVGLP